MIVHLLICDTMVLAVCRDLGEAARLRDMAEQMRRWETVEIQSFALGEIRNAQLRSLAGGHNAGHS